jgi:CRP-like cAMP-binding protein
MSRLRCQDSTGRRPTKSRRKGDPLNAITGTRRAASSEALESIVVALSRGAPISASDQDQIRLAGRMANVFGPGMQVFANAAARRTGLIVSGWACETSVMLDGRRQILSVLLPGDPIFPRRGRGGRSIMALTALEVADISSLIGLDGAPSSLSHAMKNALDQREERLFNQITRLGRLSAYERVVHLLLELRDRLALVGQVDRDAFRMPLTQEAMADVLGLSVVHVNRTLQQLRRERLVEIRAGRATLLRPRALASIMGQDAWDEDVTVDGSSLNGAEWAAA